jgi:peptidyl-prolyl cis-trans isomerase SurA
MRPRAHLAVSVALALAALGGAASSARAMVVERIVAVIGDRPILLSELRKRSRPLLLDVARRLPPGPQRAAAESQIYNTRIKQLIDEELEAQAAEKAHIGVTNDEIDAALRNIAASQSITVAELLKTTARFGLSEVEYRDELRRQILEGKMLSLRVKGRVRITEEDVKAIYERSLREERQRREYRPRWIVLRVPEGSSPAASAERMALAKKLVLDARRGVDFGALAKHYSDDTATRESGGDLGIRAPNGSPQAQSGQQPSLAPELDAACATLDPGQVADPIRIADAIVILQVMERQPSRYRNYEEAKPEMVQRLQTEILGKAKRKWLDELKARTHVDVRL